MVRRGGGERTAVPHVISRSPGGLAWGYEGDGPSDTALSILAHLTSDPGVAQRRHDEFTHEVVARLSVNVAFHMDSSIVEGWLRDRGVAVTGSPAIPDPARTRAAAEAWRRFDETLESGNRLGRPAWDRSEAVVAAVREWLASFALDLHSAALDRYEADLDRREPGAGNGIALDARSALQGPQWSSHVEVGWRDPYEVIGSCSDEQLWAELDATTRWLQAHGQPAADRSRAVEEAVATWRRRPPIEDREACLRERRRSLHDRRDGLVQRHVELTSGAAPGGARRPGSGLHEAIVAAPAASPPTPARPRSGAELGL